MKFLSNKIQLCFISQYCEVKVKLGKEQAKPGLLTFKTSYKQTSCSANLQGSVHF